MINEWEEFCAYTGTVSYTASKKSDTKGFILREQEKHLCLSSRLFFVYSAAASELPPRRNHLHNRLSRVTM